MVTYCTPSLIAIFSDGTVSIWPLRVERSETAYSTPAIRVRLIPTDTIMFFSIEDVLMIIG
jgi:hypothetical protein